MTRRFRAFVTRGACCACGTLLLALALPTAARDPPPSVRVPFVSGLTTVRATSELRGDYETCALSIRSPLTGYRITTSGEAPADDGRGVRGDVDDRLLLISERRRTLGCREAWCKEQQTRER